MRARCTRSRRLLVRAAAFFQILLHDVCVRNPIDGVGFRSGGLVEHDSSEVRRVFTLEGLDDVFCLFWLQIHLCVNDHILACRQAQIHLGLLVQPVRVDEVNPGRQRDVRVCTSIAVIEIGASAALAGIVELYEEEIEPGSLDRIGQMCIRDDTLRSTRDVERPLSVAERGIGAQVIYQ